MLNLIGESSSMEPIENACAAAMDIPGATVHLYGKSECRKGRKMGHITITGDSDAQVHSRIRPVLEAMSDLSSKWIDEVSPPPPAKSHCHSFPLVGIIMGSDSDLPTMLPAARMLDKFNVPYELTIISAHRTPGRMVQYAHEAAGRGLKCIIAGAGGAAHLPGMVASETVLPVIGVPVKASVLDGVDSLYSIVQMPVSQLPRVRCGLETDRCFFCQRGIPVATVGIANSTNAGLLAVRILSTSLPQLAAELAEYSGSLEKEVLAKVDTLAEVGWEQYVVNMQK
jgi:phosphoribosylaminoimidazole carboxylase